MMQLTARSALLATILVSSFGLVACQKHSEHDQNTTKAAASATNKSNSTTTSQVASEVSTPSSIRQFSATPDDAYDIQQLQNFIKNFHDMTQEMRTELEQLKQQNRLTAEFVEQRKHDQIHSALNMLKDLDLKTEQGRYIQGLMYEYWDQRQQQTPTTKVDKAPMIQATEQLEYWKAHTPDQ
ncbi:hypothetical protein [Acinetobacter sp. MB5]|uniref:hypothetical protein n=1 Tax=Acinetobacter sp. MB5 TaxID=2069438 RepID=UPI000DD005E6|nr:hypothetical protein [Acinetobacter sp. MB5]